MAPAGAVGWAGGVGRPGAGLAVGAGDEGVGLGVGYVGSTGPAPGAATGLPAMVDEQASISMGLTSTGATSRDPPARLHRALCENRTRHSRPSPNTGTSDYARSNESPCKRAPIDATPMVKLYRCVTDVVSAARWAAATMPW
jgi:hypothetical protein